MRKKRYRLFIISCFVISFICVAFQNTLAGSLDSFEQSIEKDNAKDQEYSSRNSSSISSEQCESDSPPFKCIGYFMLKTVVSGLFDGFFNELLAGGLESVARVNTSINIKINKELIDKYVALHIDDQTEETKLKYEIHLRELGDPQLPYARLDGSYQYISSNVSANDYRLALGYGPFAFKVNQTQYTELSPKDSLDLTRLYITYRMSSGATQIDIGMGRLVIDGNDRSKLFYSTLPIRFHVKSLISTKLWPAWLSNTGIEFKPAWSGNISDYDLGLFYHFKFASVKAGYRWLSTDTQSLSGPYAGITVFY